MTTVFSKRLLVTILLFVILATPLVAFAGPLTDTLEEVGKPAGYQRADVFSAPIIAGLIIRAFLGLLGVVFLVLLVYGGYLWMTAQGEDEQVKKAKDLIRNAIIGLIIVLSAFGITAFVFNKLKEATTI